MGKKYDVVSIGGIVADILVRPVDVGCFDRDSTMMEEIAFHPGGDAQNCSITLTRLGKKVALIGVMGTDPFGNMVYEYTSGVGVDMTHVYRADSGQTSTVVALVEPDGQRHFLGSGGIEPGLGAEHIDMSILEQTRIFSINSMFNSPNFDGEPAAKVLARAQELGVITCSDTGGDRFGLGLKGIATSLAHLDYFIPSEYEITALTGETDIEKNCDILLDMGVKNVVIKMGKYGCFIKNKDIAKQVPTYLAKPIDTTGSGDNFVAGFLSAVLEGKNLEECAMRGNACGSINSLKLGATGAVQSMEQVLDFMANTPFEIY
jgi:sugar/nucleoside kinase (ribokinase family)